jgi:hypothetical protein
VFRAYFDGSGKEDDPNAKFVTLAGIAAEEQDWDWFENTWSQILKDRGDPGYMHMAEAIRSSGPFDGWAINKVEFLIQGLVGLLREMRKDRFRVFRCSIEIEPWKRWTRNFKLKPIPRVCAKWAFRNACLWYATFPDKLILQKVEAVYDRNEEFLKHIHADWTSNKRNLAEPWWNLVSKVASEHSKLVPALQAADALAWSHNRLLCDVRDPRADRLAKDVTISLPSLDVVMDEPSIRKVYGRIVDPDPGLIFV